MLPRLSLAALLACAATASAAEEACPFKNAIYAPAGGDGEAAADPPPQRYRLRHLPRAPGNDIAMREVNQADYVLRIEEQTGKQAFHFGFAFPNGHAWTKLLYMGAGMPGAHQKSNPKGPRSGIMYFDAKMGVAGTDPEGPATAPAFLIMPDLAAGFWYGRTGGGTFAPPEGLWRIAQCVPKQE